MNSMYSTQIAARSQACVSNKLSPDKESILFCSIKSHRLARALLFSLGAMLAFWWHGAGAMESKKIFQMHEERVFQIRVLNRETDEKHSIGSGFIVGDGYQVATNFHVIGQAILEPERFYISYLAKDGREGELSLLALDVAHDLALLGSAQFLGEGTNSSDLPPPGAPIYAMGNPLDLGLSIAVGTNGGILNQTDDSRILFSGSLNPGMSGGPVFNELGEVIGINVATARNNISFIVPSSYLYALIDQANSNALIASQDLKAEVARQLLDYEKGYIKQLLDADWSSLQLRKLSLPGVISPTVRCWDNSAKLNASALYQRFQIRCANQNHVYLDSINKFVGNLSYNYYWLESDTLDRVRFYHLYEKLNKDQIEARLDQDTVSNFNCDTWFIEVSGKEFKANLCRREYVEYPGLSDVLFTAALAGQKNQGFFFTLILTGTDYQSSLPLVQKFLEQIVWNP